MTAFTQKGFTIIEFSVIIVIIGILAAALFPNYNASQQKSRDVARVTSTDTLAKSLSVYFLDKEKYPSAVAGCIPDAIINKYNDGKSILDRVPTHDNGCGPNGNY